MPEERRTNRSDNVYEALGLQLNTIAVRANFSALILTEDHGLTVASTGNTEEVEEFAALSPQLAPGCRFWQGKIRGSDGSNKVVTVAPIETDTGQLYLCALGGISTAVTAELLLGGHGVNRILA